MAQITITTDKPIGEQLREIRQLTDYNGTEWAERVGLAQPAVSHIENGVAVPSLERFLSWIDAAGLEVVLKKKKTKTNEPSAERFSGIMKRRERKPDPRGSSREPRPQTV